jgi:hypothetical protein
MVSDETRRKMSESHKRRLADPNIRHKMSLITKKRYEDPKERELSAMRSTGKRHSEETKKKLRDMRIGNKNPFYGKHHTSDAIISMSGKRTGSGNGNYGKPMPEKTKCLLRSYTGDKTSNWKGGYSKLKDLIRASSKYNEWRLAVFTRDGFKDYYSGEGGPTLQVHHITPLNVIIKRNNILTVEDAARCDELWDTNNGITMTKTNHHAYHNMWGN